MPERFKFETLLPQDSALGMPAIQGAQSPAVDMSPTLFIGLGSTGFEIARRLKRRMQANLGEDGTGACQFLVFDTRPQSEHHAGSPLLANEYVYLPAFQVEKLTTNLGEDTPLGRWWPYSYVPEYRGKGTDGSRALGRLIGYKYALSFIAPRLRGKLEAAWNESTANYKTALFRIYIVGSLAGGTGSGMLVDMAYLARNEMESGYSSDYVLTAALVMPSAFLPSVTSQAKRLRMQANGYAALLELDTHNAGTPYDTEPVPGYKLSKKTAGKRPFDFTYLVSRSNENGLTLPTVDAVCEMVSHALVLENMPQARGTISGTPEPEKPRRRSTAKPAAYGSLGVGALLFPLQGVAGWCALKASAPFIRNVILGPIRGKETAEREGEALLEYVHMGQAGAAETAQALITDEHGVTFQPYLLDPSAFEKLPEPEFRATLENALAYSLGRVDETGIELDNRLRAILAVKEEGICLTANQALRDPERGLQFADWLLAQVAIKLNSFRASFVAKDHAKGVQRAQQAEARLESARHGLEQALARPPIFPGRRGAVRTAVKEFAAAANELAAARLHVMVLDHTLNVYHSLLDSVARLAQGVKQLIFTLEAEAQEALKEAEYARSQLRLAQNRPGLARSLVDDYALSSIYEGIAITGRSAYEKRKMLEAFWAYVGTKDDAERGIWELGQQRSPSEPGRTMAYEFLCADIERRLAQTPLLDRLKSASNGDWKGRVQEQYKQTAPFWSLLPTRQVKELNKHRRNVDIVGYGEDAANSAWAREVEQALGAKVATVQTRSNQEIDFLREAHGMPLTAIREFEVDLQPAYETLQADWRSGKIKVPVHTSRRWEPAAEAPAEPEPAPASEEEGVRVVEESLPGPAAVKAEG